MKDVSVFRRGSLRFSLRTMLVFCLVVSGPIAMVGSKIAASRRQEAAIEALQQRGVALFNLHKGVPRGQEWMKIVPGFASLVDVRHAHLRGTQFGDADMATLDAFEHLEFVVLDHTAVRGNGLEHLSSFVNLMSVDVTGTPVRGVDLARLRQLRGLKVLRLAGTLIGDADMPLICELKSIEFLDISRTKITDAGLSELRRLPQLMTLLLTDCQGITPQAVIHLAACKQLEFLEVSGTRVTEAAIEQILKFPSLRLLTVGSLISDDSFEELIRNKSQKCELRRN